jgi:ATP-dependent helicase/nuclease subunit B
MILTKENIKEINLDELINEKIISGRIEELLLIVPTNRKSRNLKKEIVSLMPGKAVTGIHVETIGTVSSKLLKENRPFVNLSEASSVVFIKQSVDETKLRYFSIYKNEIPFGTLDKIKNVVSEYKRHGIDPERLRAEAELLEKSEKLKTLDIADIYEKYLIKCGKLNAYETGDIYKKLNSLTEEQFKTNFKKLFTSVNLIVVNGFDEFAFPEIQILERLTGITSAKLFINFDYYGNKYLFAHLDKIYERFEELGFIRVKDTSPAELNKFQNTIREKLFKTTSAAKKHNYKDSITKLIAYDRDAEIEIISREVKELILQKKVEPSEICLAFNRIQNYSSIVRDVFTKNGIPFNLTDRVAVDNSNPVTAIINFLEITENDFYFNNIFRALNSGFINTHGIDSSNLFKIASALKIVSGKENWINSIGDEISNLYSKEDDEIVSKKSLYKKALNDILSIAEKLKPFEEKMTFPEFRDRLFDLIYISEVPINILKKNSSVADSAEENIRGFTGFIDTITEVFNLLEEEYGKDKKFGLTFFMDQMRTACGWARFNVKEKSNYGVQVTSFEEIRGLHFEYLFIGGMCDGDFPTRYQPEIFFSGSFKKQAAVHQTEERNLFYQTLCCWKKHLYFSYPLSEGGRETVISTFLNDFEEVFEISEKSMENYSNSIYSHENAQIHFGKIAVGKLPDSISAGYNYEKIIDKVREGKKQKNDFTESSSNVADILKSFESKQYSISQLEMYAKCPFKFFVERVLGIQKVEEPTEDIEAVELGRILHSVLYEFYIKIRNEKIILAGCNEETFNKVKEIIFNIAAKEIERTAFKSPLAFFEKEKILGIGGNKDESIINRFLEEEREEESGYKPEYFEVSFGRLKDDGSDKILSSKNPIQIDKINLRGKIDRIEISEEDSAFNIVDYKLGGAKPSFKELKDGISLQLPVYLYAAKELLNIKFNKNYSPNEMIIYSLKYSLDSFGKDIVSLNRRKDEEIKTIEQLIENTIKHIKNYIEQISEGKFGLSPHGNREQLVCRYCQFKSVCRVEENG